MAVSMAFETASWLSLEMGLAARPHPTTSELVVSICSARYLMRTGHFFAAIIRPSPILFLPVDPAGGRIIAFVLLARCALHTLVCRIDDRLTRKVAKPVDNSDAGPIHIELHRDTGSIHESCPKTIPRRCGDLR